MDKSNPTIFATTQTLPFDKLSPRDFERLCLWLVEREGYEKAEHLGAAGKEQGRDIIAWRDEDGYVRRRVAEALGRIGTPEALATLKKAGL